MFCAIKALSSSEGDSFEYKTRIVRECINTHLKSNNGTALINDAFQRAIDSEFIQNICTEGAEQSSVILSDETGQCLFTIQDNQVVRSLKMKVSIYPLFIVKILTVSFYKKDRPNRCRGSLNTNPNVL